MIIALFKMVVLPLSVTADAIQVNLMFLRASQREPGAYIHLLGIISVYAACDIFLIRVL